MIEPFLGQNQAALSLLARDFEKEAEFGDRTQVSKKVGGVSLEYLRQFASVQCDVSIRVAVNEESAKTGGGKSASGIVDPRVAPVPAQIIRKISMLRVGTRNVADRTALRPRRRRPL